MTKHSLYNLLQQRILILDGAMGTMIQRYKLDEAAYRGKKFASHPVDINGNNELLVLTKPDVIEEIHAAYLTRARTLSRPIPLTPTASIRPNINCRTRPTR